MQERLVGLGTLAGLTLGGLALAQPAAPPGSSAAMPPPPAPAESGAAPAPSAQPTAPPVAPQPAQPPGAYPYYPQQPPPAGYGYPPPGYPYPPPGYGYPPPGYVYPPEQQPPRPRFPDDAAAQTSPFLDLLVAGMAWDRRFSHFFNIGMQAGAYVSGRLRLSVRGVLLTSEPDDELANDYGYDGASVVGDGFSSDASDPPAFIYGATVGFAGIARRNFVFSPGIAGWRTDVSDYGNFFGLALPFEWVTDDGARFGFEVDVGRAFGGTVHATCFDTSSAAPCSSGERKDFDRPSGTAFYGSFQFGWGFNHPEAVMPSQ